MNFRIDPGSNLDNNAERTRWLQIQKAINDLLNKVNQAPLYGVQSPPAGGHIAAETMGVTNTVTVGTEVVTKSLTANGGLNTGQNTFHVFTGTSDPGGAAVEGDIWIDG